MLRYQELAIHRILGPTYTARDLEPFARDLGYDGDAVPWDEERRNRLNCEPDAIFADLRHLDRPDLERTFDAPYPGASFSGLKRKGLAQFGDYRPRRYFVHAYDQMARGRVPKFEAV